KGVWVGRPGAPPRGVGKTHSHWVRGCAAPPLPSATTWTRRARSRPWPVPIPVHSCWAMERRGCAPSPPRHHENAAESAHGGLDPPPDLGGRPVWRTEQHELTAVQERGHHLWPAG